MIALFREMVAISSESGEEYAFIDYLETLFATELSATCQRDAFGNLIAKLDGRGCERTKPILIGLHADTVKPGRGIEAVVHDGVIRAVGPTILGADDKAGIAEVVEAIKRADRHPPLEIVVTREEEVGLKGARNLDYSLLRSVEGI